jgi:hypothetical protein
MPSKFSKLLTIFFTFLKTFDMTVADNKPIYQQVSIPQASPFQDSKPDFSPYYQTTSIAAILLGSTFTVNISNTGTKPPKQSRAPSYIFFF